MKSTSSLQLPHLLHQLFSIVTLLVVGLNEPAFGHFERTGNIIYDTVTASRIVVSSKGMFFVNGLSPSQPLSESEIPGGPDVSHIFIEYNGTKFSEAIIGKHSYQLVGPSAFRLGRLKIYVDPVTSFLVVMTSRRAGFPDENASVMTFFQLREVVTKTGAQWPSVLHLDQYPEYIYTPVGLASEHGIVENKLGSVSQPPTLPCLSGKIALLRTGEIQTLSNLINSEEKERFLREKIAPSDAVRDSFWRLSGDGDAAVVFDMNNDEMLLLSPLGGPAHLLQRLRSGKIGLCTLQPLE